jgi:hypothetical protein
VTEASAAPPLSPPPGSAIRPAVGLRVRWLLAGVPAFTLGWAAAQAMGEVVGEAWGGASLHLLGHTLGTVLLVGLLAAAAWLVLRERVPWVARCGVAATAGSLVGLMLYLPVLAFAPANVAELTIALTLHLPLLTAAVFMAVALRGDVRRPYRWALNWYLGVLFGVAAEWFTAGGLAGASTGSLHPIFERAVAYGWQRIPQSLLGALVYAAWTAWTLPTAIAPHRPAPTWLARRPSARRHEPRTAAT